MSDTQEETLEIVEQEEEQPDMLWLSGVPVFIGTVDNTIAKAKAMGFQVFFVLAQETTETGVGQQKVTKTEPALYKVMTNLIGSSITKADNVNLGLNEVEKSAWFGLPEIPYQLISDIDDFFREVYRKHGTEAIVMLTFDPAYLEDETRPEGMDISDGWGVLVPKQTNDAGRCDYVPESVVEEKPDEVYIVGTCHSHPGMSAFCSGVDKADQASFDGIHITFGWSKGSTKTDFHCELQLGQAWTMKPENLFKDVPAEIANERIKGWIDKVEKKGHKPHSTSSYSPTSQKPPGSYSWDGNKYSYKPGTGGSSSSYKSPDEKRKEKYPNLPSDCPLPDINTVIARVDEDVETMMTCPCCNAVLNAEMVRKARCSDCMVYLMWEGVTLDDLIKRRRDLGLIALEIDPKCKPDRAIYVWSQEYSQTGLIETVTCIWEGNHSGKGSAGSDSGNVASGFIYCPQCGAANSRDDRFCWEMGCEAPLSYASNVRSGERRILGTDELDFEVDEDLLDQDFGPYDALCCNKDVSDCKCPKPILYDEVEDYIYNDTQQRGFTVYADNNCADCIFQYSAQCPGYRMFLRDYTETLETSPEMQFDLLPDPITVCSLFTGVHEEIEL